MNTDIESVIKDILKIERENHNESTQKRKSKITILLESKFKDIYQKEKV